MNSIGKRKDQTITLPKTKCQPLKICLANRKRGLPTIFAGATLALRKKHVNQLIHDGED